MRGQAAISASSTPPETTLATWPAAFAPIACSSGYALFIEEAENLVTVAHRLADMVESYDRLDEPVREVIRTLETAIDDAEDAAEVIERILAKGH